MSELFTEINTSVTALLTNLFDAFDINNDNKLDLNEFQNLVSFIFIVHETSININEIQNDDQLNQLISSYHDQLSANKTKELSIFFPNKDQLDLDDFLNTLTINPLPNNWEKLAYFKELCIQCYGNKEIFNHIASKFNTVLNTAIPLDDNTQNTLPNQAISNQAISNQATIPSSANLNSIETYNNNPPITITNQEEGFDIIEGEVNIKNYMKEDPGNIALYYSDHWYLTNKNIIQNMIDTTKPDNQIVYKCNTASGYLGDNNDRVNNVDKTKKYFRLRNIGLYDYMPYDYIEYLINNTTNKYYIVEATNETLPSVVSDNVINHQGSWVSASHCQDGQSGKVYILKILKPNFQEGGRKYIKNSKKHISKKNKKRKSRQTKKHT